MQANSPVVVATGILSGVTVGVLCMCAALFLEGRSLRRQLSATSVEAARLRSHQNVTHRDLSAQRERLESLATEVERLQQAADPPEQAGGTDRQARRARVYLGDRMVGLGWVMTSPPDVSSNDPGADSPADVVLDLHPGATAGPAPAPVDAVAASPGQAYAYQYRHETYPYWPYWYTSGWIEWPMCTNPPAFNGGVAIAPDASPPSSAPPAPSLTQAPAVAAVAGTSPAAWRTRLRAPVPATANPRTVAAPRSAPSASFARVPTTAPAAARGSAPATAARRSPVSSPARVPVGTRR